MRINLENVVSYLNNNEKIVQFLNLTCSARISLIQYSVSTSEYKNEALRLRVPRSSMYYPKFNIRHLSHVGTSNFRFIYSQISA